ncbi:Mbeg1-like protein [Neobacillus dielmonensis]|uniref:Mbeg1-like protein n=1 Tax=Neobacillus dielmonensis TaxID=1347369 RepID=UPI0005A5EE18|nr:Mbeg1-like protein [Neobacillus dielmonensis]
MSLDNLNDEEKNILLQLSYFDLPEGRYKGLSVEQIWQKVKRIPDNGGDARREALEEYFGSERYKNSDLANVVLNGYQNNNPNMGGKSESGFVGYAWGDGDGNATAVFRGSENPLDWDHFKTDWVSNGSAGIGNEIQQQEEASRFYQQFVHPAEGEKFVFGHSKGGNLASYVFVHYLEDDVNGYVINGAPIFWPSLTREQQDALRGEKFDFIVYDGDFVHDLGFAPYVDKVVEINKNVYLDPFYPHYETSVNFKNGSFEKVSPGGIYTPGDLMGEIIKFELVYTIQGGRKIYQAAIFMRDAALMVISATWKGMKEAAQRVIDGCVAVYQGLKNVTSKVIKDVRNIFAKLQQKVNLALAQIAHAISGGQFVVEPYIKVNLHRLAYYAHRLQAIKRKTDEINSEIDSLYLKVGITGFDNLLKADILTTFHFTINQNINYLKTAASLLEGAESRLLAKARSLH